MADTEFGQYKQSYRRGYEQQLAKKKLEALLRSSVGTSVFDTTKTPYPPQDSLGLVRDFLAPSDTSAYPTHALNVPVYRSSDLGARIGKDYTDFTVGDYDPAREKIRLLDDLDFIGRHAGMGRGNPYETLLHESGHARGFSQIPNIKYDILFDSEKKLRRMFALMDSLKGEGYAQHLADSLYKR